MRNNILEVVRMIFEQVNDDKVKEKALALIPLEKNSKY